MTFPRLTNSREGCPFQWLSAPVKWERSSRSLAKWGENSKLPGAWDEMLTMMEGKAVQHRAEHTLGITSIKPASKLQERRLLQTLASFLLHTILNSFKLSTPPLFSSAFSMYSWVTGGTSSPWGYGKAAGQHQEKGSCSSVTPMAMPFRCLLELYWANSALQGWNSPCLFCLSQVSLSLYDVGIHQSLNKLQGTQQHRVVGQNPAVQSRTFFSSGSHWKGPHLKKQTCKFALYL